MAGRKRRRGKGFLFLVFLLVIVIAVGYILWQGGYFKGIIPPLQESSDSADSSGSDSGSVDSSESDSGSSDSSGSDSGSAGESIVTDELAIYFPMLGNKSSGDCTLIKAGDTEILIDAGSEKSSAATLVPYISQYCTDGVLEYVIATHADQDHIAAFVGTSTAPGIFQSFRCGTIIDFPRTNKTTQIYNNYVTLREEEVEAGAVHYTALECWNGENGASRSYTIAEGITMNFLYQRFYEEKSSDENNYSVCMLLTQGSNHYLFTGDLEAEGEASLLESNDLPRCRLFKAGHHGSPTSNGAALLSVIRPEIVVVCCCCGNYKEYNFSSMDVVFPSQAFVDNVAPYTDKIYIPTLYSETEGFVPMNGNISVLSDGGEVYVRCSENDTVFKDTEWFGRYRQWPQAAA